MGVPLQLYWKGIYILCEKWRRTDRSFCYAAVDVRFEEANGSLRANVTRNCHYRLFKYEHFLCHTNNLCTTKKQIFHYSLEETEIRIILWRHNDDTWKS